MVEHFGILATSPHPDARSFDTSLGSSECWFNIVGDEITQRQIHSCLRPDKMGQVSLCVCHNLKRTHMLLPLSVMTGCLPSAPGGETHSTLSPLREKKQVS